MTRRAGRSDLPPDPGATLRALGACRQAMIDVMRTVKPMGPAYHAASMVASAIDGFATFLTGERYYFSIGCTVPWARTSERPEPESEDPKCP